MAVNGVDATTLSSWKEGGGEEPGIKRQTQPGVWEVSGLTRDGIAETVSRDQFQAETGTGQMRANDFFPC